MMQALRFLEKFFSCGEISKKNAKKSRKREKEHILFRVLPQKPQTVGMRKLVQLGPRRRQPAATSWSWG